MDKLRPLSDRVIVKRHETPDKTESGIALVNQKNKPLRGTVLEVGPGRWLGDKLIEPAVKPGDVVLFGERAGEEVEVDFEDIVLVLREAEILAILDE